MLSQVSWRWAELTHNPGSLIHQEAVSTQWPLNHLPRQHLHQVEQWDQLVGKLWWLFSQWSEKRVKIVHHHMLGLKIVFTADPFIRIVQPAFFVCLGESSNNQKPLVADARKESKTLGLTLTMLPFLPEIISLVTWFLSREFFLWQSPQDTCNLLSILLS